MELRMAIFAENQEIFVLLMTAPIIGAVVDL
jgi:hypothetical protein